MKSLSATLHKEIEHFKSLADHTRTLFLSIFLWGLTQPIFSLFINAFLWKENHDFLSLALYNLAWFFGVPLGFYINGVLLRRYTPTKLYIASMILLSIFVGALIFSHETSIPFLLMFGFLVGTTAGMYWGNRNFIELYLVANTDRNYFYSILGTMFSIVNVFMPLIIGWFIVSGQGAGLYSSQRAYEILIVLATIILIFAGRMLIRYDTKMPRSTTLFTSLKSALWRKVRWMSFTMGMSDGVTQFLSALMVLYLIGNEVALGTITSTAALAGGVGIYILGRVSKPNNRAAISGAGVIILIFVSLIFSYLYSPLAAIIYNIGLAFYSIFFTAGHDPILYAAIEKDNRTEDPLHYARLCDREIFLNLGRICGIAVFITLFLSFSPDSSLRLSPLITAITQLPLLILLPRIMRSSNAESDSHLVP